MAGRNCTGPMGEGPMTGRGLGYCNNDNVSVKEIQSGNNGQVYGRGARGTGRGLRQGYGKGNACGKGFGRSNGCRRGLGINNGFSYADEEAYLNDQQIFLENQLNQVKSRLNKFNNNAE